MITLSPISLFFASYVIKPQGQEEPEKPRLFKKIAIYLNGYNAGIRLKIKIKMLPFIYTLETTTNGYKL